MPALCFTTNKMKKSDRQRLLQIARRAIEKYLQKGEVLKMEKDDLPLSFQEKNGVFVTLWENQELRGCIGSLESDKPVYENVIDNSLASALFDSRFTPLKAEEMNEVKIEISILSPLRQMRRFEHARDLLNYLQKHQSGLLIKKGGRQATFLPQVWEELPAPASFLSRLCEKAGLDAREWEKMDLEIYQYEAEVFKES